MTFSFSKKRDSCHIHTYTHNYSVMLKGIWHLRTKNFMICLPLDDGPWFISLTTLFFWNFIYVFTTIFKTILRSHSILFYFRLKKHFVRVCREKKVTRIHFSFDSKMLRIPHILKSLTKSRVYQYYRNSKADNSHWYLSIVSSIYFFSRLPTKNKNTQLIKTMLNLYLC